MLSTKLVVVRNQFGKTRDSHVQS
jgi:hypothetical protein